jgi:ubiquinone biosynthesis protein COQ9
VLFWLGDDSPGHQATWEFLDRRIEDVMQIEKLKGALPKFPGPFAPEGGFGKAFETLRTAGSRWQSPDNRRPF